MKTLKTLLAILLAAILVIGMLPVFAGAEEPAEEEFTPIYTIEDLYCVRYDPAGSFKLMNDIDMTDDVAEGGDWDIGYGWAPICEDASTAFTGCFDGQGYTITGLRIADPVSGCTGLFGYLNGATVKNVTLDQVNIVSARENVGALAGYATSSNISGITVSHASVTSTGTYTGGIVGRLNGSQSAHSTIRAGSFHGTVSGGASVGGIVGYMGIYTDVSECYANGSVIGTTNVGGIVGCAEGHGDGNDSSASIKITSCYNLASVSATANAGGIAGSAHANGYSGYSYYYSRITISQCYSLGAVLSEDQAGAIIGKRTVDNSNYSSVNVPQNYYLLGTAPSGVYGSDDTAATCVALTAAQSRLKAVYGYLDFENVWFFDSSAGITHPQLRAIPEPLQIIDRLCIAALPDNLTVPEGGMPDLTGGKLAMSTAEGAPTVDMTSATLLPFDSSRAGKATVTLAFEDQTVAFEVTVLHDYDVVVVPESCTAGYSLYTCKVCGNQRIENITNGAGHWFGEWNAIGGGQFKRTCSICGLEDIGKITQEMAGDLNGDGYCSIQDVTILLVKIAA